MGAGGDTIKEVQQKSSDLKKFGFDRAENIKITSPCQKQTAILSVFTIGFP
jgi:hypothetical protein